MLTIVVLPVMTRGMSHFSFLSNDGGTDPVWKRNGGELYFPLVVPALWRIRVHAAVGVWYKPRAFVAGAMGPIVGADLLHIRQFTSMNTGIASIGGASTFDGIVFSCIVAAYLA
jgi:uncharacterized protein DUF1614